MTRINNTDQIMALLRHQLQRMAKPDGARKTAKPSSADKETTSSAVHRISALTRNENLSEEDFERAFIRALLIDELGEALAEDHRFDRIANQVHQMIAMDEKAGNLLTEAISQLTMQGRS